MSHYHTTTPSEDHSYHHNDDLEKAVAVSAPLHMDKFDAEHKLHRKRFLCWSLTKKQWIWSLVGSIVGVLLVVVLILFLAVIPAIFQAQVDKVELTLNHLDLIKMSGDPNSKEIGVDISIHVVSDAMAAATMYETKAALSYKGTTFGVATIPETQLKAGKYEFDIVIRATQEVDPAAFRAVAEAVVQQETLEVGAEASVKIKAMGLTKGGLSLKRTLKVKGINQFSDPISVINHITVTSCTTNEYKMLTNLTIDNDSNIGLNGIGVLNMTVYSRNLYLGQAISLNGPEGIPRGPTAKLFEITVQKTGPNSGILGLTSLLKDLVVKKAQMYITGNNPYAVTQAVLLDTSLTKLNMSVPYTNALDPAYMTLNTSAPCMPLLALVSA